MPRFEIDIPEERIPWTYGLRFCGQVMQHSPYVFHHISNILLKYPVHSIVELGTGHGGMAMYLGLWGARLDIPVATFDIAPELSEGAWDVLDALDVHRLAVDVLSAGAVEIIEGIIDGKPTYLVCDGGDKPAEFAYYAPILPVGSVISIHDWGTEVTELKGPMEHDVQLEFVDRENWEAHDLRLATVQKIGDVRAKA